MRADCRIGVVQINAVVGDVQGNLARMEAYVHQAALSGVDILCFPECNLTGYDAAKAQTLALPLGCQALGRCSQWAQESGITLLVGFFEKGTAAKPFISQAVMFPDGAVQVYRKVHLGRSEKAFVEGGTEFPVFSSHGTVFGIGICWDWHFPEMATIYSLKGAEVLFAPHASPVVSGDRREIWLRYIPARAYDNSVYVGACNLIGDNGEGKEFSGGALILGPKGDILAESFAGKEGITVARISAERVNRIRAKERASMSETFFLADRRKELYGGLLTLEPKYYDDLCD